MKILVTGSAGFVGRNLVLELQNRGHEILGCTLETTREELEQYTQECGFVFHLAGVNRPKEEKEFFEGNAGFTEEILALLEQAGNRAPVALSSSIQAERDNPYGRSKRQAEDLLFTHGEKTGAPVYAYRLPNLFGKWSMPNYNSVVATFCFNIARGLPVTIHDPDSEVPLCYIDDLVGEFLRCLGGKPTIYENRENGDQGRYCTVPEVYRRTVGRIASLLEGFRESRKTLSLPNLSDPFERKLYSTYLSYLPEDSFSYPLVTHSDHRGSFTEFLRTPDRGQVSVNVSKPGITKGNHWHHTKNEKFLVVSGQGLIRFRRVDGEEILEYPVSGEKLEVVDIPPGYTHTIANTGETDLVTVMWVNECYDPNKPDTYVLEVEKP
ncbi:MAG: capsular polysaccharide biosynthesis protein CapF [Bacteroidia bacterium]|nr:capsular polysaccharide biosynthesis protein CapF [Bacteroidia bacterium]